MKEWMAYIKEYHKADEVYKKLNIANNHALVDVITKIVEYVKEENIRGTDNAPVYDKAGVVDFLANYPADFKPKKELLKTAFDNNIGDRPFRTTDMNRFPVALQEEFKAVFEEYESVQNGLIKFKVNVTRPGDIVMAHYDSPASLAYGIPYEQTHLEHRLLIFMTEWQNGQVVQMGNDLLQWKKYDAVKWSIKNCMHGGANFGFDERIAFVVSWVQKE